MDGFGVWRDVGLFGAFRDVARLAEIQTRVLLHDVDAEKGFEVVRLRDGVARLEEVAEFANGSLTGRGDGEVVDMDAKVYTLAVWVEAVEEAGVVFGAGIAVRDEEGGELVVEGFWSAIEAIQCALEAPYARLAIWSNAFWETNVYGFINGGSDERSEYVETVETVALLSGEGE